MSHFMFCSHGWLQRSGWRYCDFGRYSSPWLLRIKSFYFHFGKPRIYLFNYNSFGHFTTKSLSVSNKLPNTKFDKTKIGKVSNKRLLILVSDRYRIFGRIFGQNRPISFGRIFSQFGRQPIHGKNAKFRDLWVNFGFNFWNFSCSISNSIFYTFSKR